MNRRGLSRVTLGTTQKLWQSAYTQNRCLTTITNKTKLVSSCSHIYSQKSSTVNNKYYSTVVKKKKEFSNLENSSDEEIITAVSKGSVNSHDLEKHLPNDLTRAVSLRRTIVETRLIQTGNSTDLLKSLPFETLNYKDINGACCENVIGYVPIPVGMAGPVLLDGKYYHVPMATTEGCLVASTHRGMKAITEAGGARAVLLDDGMTRGPAIRFPNVTRAAAFKYWVSKQENFYKVAGAFNRTSSYARLSSVKANIAGRIVYLRFKSSTGDAMGMNMISKGVENALKEIQTFFPDMKVLSLSGNFCTDKKPSAINWLEGRGKSVISEVTIPKDIITRVLKTSVPALVDLNVSKNLIGSAMAGSIGGFNAHASNVVTAIFLATGQDPAQNVESSNCMTLMEPAGPTGEDLYMTCTMPSMEVGTIGGGTHLGPQAACLKLMGVQGPNLENPGENAAQLSKIICSAVMAGELSLMSALAAGTLVGDHMNLNRKPQSAKPHLLPHVDEPDTPENGNGDTGKSSP